MQAFERFRRPNLSRRRVLAALAALPTIVAMPLSRARAQTPADRKTAQRDDLIIVDGWVLRRSDIDGRDGGSGT